MIPKKKEGRIAEGKLAPLTRSRVKFTKEESSGGKDVSEGGRLARVR